MRIGIFENIMTPGGHEVDFDRILVEELQKRGHELSFYVPEDFQFNIDYNVPVTRLGGESISYANVSGLKKLLYSLKHEYNRQKWYAQLYEATYRKNIDALIVPTSNYRYLRALNKNILRRSKVPIIFVLHGINPKEAPKFLREAKKILPFKNIKLVVLTFVNHIFGHQLPNIYTIYPPAYVARDIAFEPSVEQKDVLTIAFFGNTQDLYPELSQNLEIKMQSFDEKTQVKLYSVNEDTAEKFVPAAFVHRLEAIINGEYRTKTKQ